MWVYQDYWRDYKPELGSAAPAAGMTDINALVDTGAGESCIDNLLAGQAKHAIVTSAKARSILLASSPA
jgi:hypothetical protein